MDVKFTENYGQVRVADDVNGKPLGKVYGMYPADHVLDA